MRRYLEIGKIVSTHGLKGQLRVEPWCNSPEFLCRFQTLYTEDGLTSYKVKRAAVQKNMVLLTLDGIDTIELAQQLRGIILFIDREDAQLEEGTYFLQDLIGLCVVDVDTGEKYGIITDVFQTGANDVYQITSDEKKEYLIPGVSEIVVETNLQRNIMKIRPIEGMIHDAD